MNKIIGRKRELVILQEMLDSPEAEMLAVYGRRRIGKTYLITNFFQGKALFFEWTGIAGGKALDQLKRFPMALAQAFQLSKQPPVPRDWHKAFEILIDHVLKVPKDQPVVLFFDELPWLSGPMPHMLRALEHAWNAYLSRRHNVILVLCGSAASWMIKRVIHNTKGLYGRLTRKIHLKPFNLSETLEYLAARNISLDKKQIVELYMTTGGVAKYLSQVPLGASSAQAIQRLCFEQSGFLRTEFNDLFRSLFDSSEHHLRITRTLAHAHEGLTFNELAKKTSLPSGGWLKSTLEELVASGFISRLGFFGKTKREAKYRVIDEYTLFYLRWIENAPFIDDDSPSSNYWISKQITPSYKAWSGYAFENLCLKHVREIIKALELSVVAENIWYWRHVKKSEEDLPGAQIDLLIERRDKVINLCEIKFYADEFRMTGEYAHKLNQRREIFRETTGYRGSIFNTLITPYGVGVSVVFHGAVDQNLDINCLFLDT